MYTIGKLAQAGGVGVETIRFYQRKGLLNTPAKNGGFRHYSNDDLQQLKFIRKAQSAGFTLQEIKELIALEKVGDRTRVRELANTRVHALEKQINELQQARNALKKLAKDCSKTNVGPCPILKSFED